MTKAVFLIDIVTRHNIATKKDRCDMEDNILTNDDLDKIWGEYCNE